MNRTFFYLLSGFLLSILLFSCDKKQGATMPEAQEPLSEVIDYESLGYVKLSTMVTATIHKDNAYIDMLLASSSDTLRLNMNTVKSPQTLPAATYTIDKKDGAGKYTYASSTWDPEYSYLLSPMATRFRDGKVTVSRSGRIFVILCDFLSLGGDSVKYYYEGQIEFQNFMYPDNDPYLNEEETDDQSFECIFDACSFYGTEYSDGTSKEYDLMLTDENGAQIILYVYASSDATAASFPTGTFAVKKTKAENTIGAGYFDAEVANNPDYGIDYAFTPSLIVSGNGQYIWYLVDGSMTVSKDKDNVYTIQGLFSTGLDTTISINYTGSISITDKVNKLPTRIKRKQ